MENQSRLQRPNGALFLRHTVTLQRLIAGAITALLMLASSASAQTAGPTSPLSIRNLYPPMMRFFDPLPDSAFLQPDQQVRLEANQHYASIYHYDFLPGGNLLVDMELYVLDIVARKSISKSVELSLRLPLLIPGSGTFDSLIQNFHSKLDMPNGGRQLRGNNSFAYRFNGHWSGAAQPELGNVVVGAKLRVAGGDNWSLAGLTAVKAPTASKSRGWGSGAADVAAGAVISWASDSYFTHLEAWYIYPFAGDEAGLTYRSYGRGSVTAGLRMSESLSAVVQAQGGQSPYVSGLPQLIHPPYLISTGLQGEAYNKLEWSIYFTENISQKTTQDISISVNLSWLF